MLIWVVLDSADVFAPTVEKVVVSSDTVVICIVVPDNINIVVITHPIPIVSYFGSK